MLKRLLSRRSRYRIHSSSHVKLRLCVIILLLVVGGGTIGYRYIENWSWLDSFYMTIITVSTVGFGETHPLSDWGRGFTAVLIIFGTGSVLFGISGLLEHLFHKQVQMLSTRYFIQRMVDKMKNHIIICGYGRMGRSVAKELMNDGSAPIVVIENSPERVEQAELDGLPVVTGDATEEENLEKAGIKNASSLVATLSNDANNLFLVVTSRGLNKGLDIIVRSEEESNSKKFLSAGASRVVSPYATGAKHIFTLLRMPAVTEFTELITREGDVKFELSQLEVDKESKFAGKILAEAGIREEYDGMVIAIRHRNGRISFNPSGNSKISPGDRLYMAVFAKR